MKTRIRWIACSALRVIAAYLCVSGNAFATCPSVLMFDGVNIQSENNTEQARYWGHIVGVQGFFLNNVMANWQQDVGFSTTSHVWQQAKQFQHIYAKYGVVNNFIKVAIWRPHDWHNAAQNVSVVSHFEHIAALAKYAGFKGIALDLEPYVPIWGGAAGGPDLAATVQAEGKAIARAMHEAYPGMTLVLIKDSLYWAKIGKGYHGGYALSVPFIRGLLSVPWKHLVVAIERTYDGKKIVHLVSETRNRYETFVGRNHLPSQRISVAPGLWPLGKSYEDKSARVSVGEFAVQLRNAMISGTDYLWIYGFGSAWQTNGPYGKGSAVSNLTEYTHILLQARLFCATTSK